jgi:hypothetical protein
LKKCAEIPGIGRRIICTVILTKNDLAKRCLLR